MQTVSSWDNSYMVFVCSVRIKLRIYSFILFSLNQKDLNHTFYRWFLYLILSFILNASNMYLVIYNKNKFTLYKYIWNFYYNILT